MPVVWVKPHCDGRVFYCSLGHDTSAFATDGVRALLVWGIRWTATA